MLHFPLGRFDFLPLCSLWPTAHSPGAGAVAKSAKLLSKFLNHSTPRGSHLGRASHGFMMLSMLSVLVHYRLYRIAYNI